MAAYFSQLKTVLKKFQGDSFKNSLGFVRHASEKFDYRVIKKINSRPIRFGFNKLPMSNVKAGELLYKQKKLNYSPGLNVKIKRLGALVALTPGKIVLSCEKTNYKTDDSLIKRWCPTHIPPYGRYINVIPEPMHKRFKLIEKF